MVEWYDMPGALDDFESHPAYPQKLTIDAAVEVTTDEIPAGEKTKARSVCSWVKKREYKKKLVCRFLSINPDMDYSKRDAGQHREGLCRGGNHCVFAWHGSSGGS